MKHAIVGKEEWFPPATDITYQIKEIYRWLKRRKELQFPMVK
jgi:hypothetical protein